MNGLSKYLIALFILSLSNIGFAQSRNREDETNQSSKKSQQSIPTPASVVMDGPVDPKEYIVGPGDIFSVSIWLAAPLNFLVAVTPEGTVVIPNVSEIVVSGMTLENAKKQVLSDIKKKFLSGEASFTLFQPRSFKVTIRGRVLNEQVLVVSAVNRVETILQVANDVELYKTKIINNEYKFYSSDKSESILQSSSRRNIKIIRKDGTSVRADLEKFVATRNKIYNPILLDGDVIVVPPNNIDQNFIGLHGAVIKEGLFEFVEGDSLLSLIEIAGGITNNADQENAVISRNDLTGAYADIAVNLAKIISKQNPDITLRKGDRILIPQKHSLNRGGIVVVEGEVSVPGTYSIIRDSTKLSEIISKAGGLTKFAMLNGAVVIRGQEKIKEKEIGDLLLRKGVTSIEDTIYYNNEIALKNKNEIVSVDFVSIFAKNELSKDITLQSGDRIVIPSKTNTVYVFGEVKFPGFIRFSKDKDVNFYLAAAGGKTEFVEEDDIRIIKAGSKQWLALNETTVEEGDYIWVPKIPYRPFVYYLGIYSQIFGIVATTASLILLVTR